MLSVQRGGLSFDVRYALACRDATNRAQAIKTHLSSFGARLVASRQAKAYRTYQPPPNYETVAAQH